MKNRKFNIKIELVILVICLMPGLAITLLSVLNYNGGLKEIVGQLHIAALIGLAVYFLVLLFRMVFWFLLFLTGEKVK